jgi:hypothetical protein
LTPQEITRLLTTQPFEPCRLFLTDGRTFDVHHPDFCLVGHRSVHLYEVDDPETRVWSNVAYVSLLHVLRAESLATTAPKGH